MTELPAPGSAWDLKALVEKALGKYADRVALRFEGATVPYADLDARTNALANALVDLGVDPEDRVGIVMRNRVEFVEAEVAAVKAGAAHVRLNYMFSDDEIRQRLSSTRASAVVLGPDFVEVFDRIRDSLPHVDHFIAVTDGAAPPDGYVSFETLRQEGDETAPPARRPSPDDIVRIPFTGGTTGEPKPVVHTHRTTAAAYYAAFSETDLSTDDVTLTSTVLARAGGTMLFGGLLVGAENVLLPGFDAGQALETIESAGVTWTFMVPTMLYRLLDHPALDEVDTSSLRTVVYGGSPITADRLREALDAFGPVFVQIYGQVEAPMFVTTLGKREHAIGMRSGDDGVLSSAGAPCLMADVGIVGPETGEPLGAGEAGEIVASTPYAMARYFERPEATAETLRDGWVYTGDIGRLDDRGYLTILDRKTDLIITGGLNVYSTEVEDVLAEHPGVREVAVIGVPDDDWGESVTAIVVPADGETASRDAIEALAEERLADYKEPKAIVFVDEIPTTPAGKPDKAALRAPYWTGESRGIH